MQTRDKQLTTVDCHLHDIVFVGAVGLPACQPAFPVPRLFVKLVPDTIFVFDFLTHFLLFIQTVLW